MATIMIHVCDVHKAPIIMCAMHTMAMLSFPFQCSSIDIVMFIHALALTA